MRADFRSEAYGLFGEKAFAFALFYQHSGALRFELAEGGSRLDMFLRALHKAETIGADVFSDADDLHVCLSAYHRGSVIEWARPVLTDLSQCDIPLPERREVWLEQLEADHPWEEREQRAFLIFPMKKHDLRKFLWGAVAKDFVIKPELRAFVYIYSLKKKTLIYPYDYRGMDVIGCDENVMGGLYRKYNDWLLDHDRPAMDTAYGTG